VILGLAAACVRERSGSAAAAAGDTLPAGRPATTLALRSPSGTEVWFTAARSAVDSTGRPCLERVMEIREGDRRFPIPLLYTGAAPRLVNDSVIEAAIWLHCRPGNVYRVSLRSGQPMRVK
jgi:hypothetical protein